MSGSAVVTLLFTDLVASTQIGQRLGEDGAEALRRAHFALLRAAIAAHEGDEVKTVGDGLMAAFRGPSQALACAVAVQRAVERANRTSATSTIGLRVGLSSGEVTVEDGDYFGTPAVEAARLCAAAAGGQILASGVVRTLAGTRGGFAFRDLGPVELKGFAQPVPACEVGWGPSEDTDAPLHPVLDVRTFLAGRGAERERLLQAWKSGARLVLVSGEPGIGKTRLVSELAVHAHDEGAIVLYGRCDDDLGHAYQPWAEALRDYVLHAPADELRAHVGTHGGELTRLVPELARRVPETPDPVRSDTADPQAERDVERVRLLDATAGLLAAAALRASLLIVLDDLHWATRPTLVLLRHLLRRNAGCTIVATYRDTDLARTHPLADTLADLRREVEHDRIALAGLDEPGVASFISGAAGQPVDEEMRRLAGAVHAETEGNPFFIGQVLRHLAETGRVFQRDGRWTYDVDIGALGIPEGVREVVGRRLARLSDAANRVLTTAAVVGAETDIDVLEAVLDDLSPDAVLDALDEAAGAGLVAEVQDARGRYRFTHTLVRQTLYEELSSARRARAHHRVGEAIETLHTGDADALLSALARHFCESARDVAKAAAYAERAARHAIGRAAHEEAVEHAARGLSVLDLDERPHSAERAALHLVLSDARGNLGDTPGSFAESERAADHARRAGSAELLAQAAWAFGGQAVFVGRVDEAIAIADDALAALPPDAELQRTRVLIMSIWNAAITGRGERLSERLDEAVALARSSGDTEAMIGTAYMRVVMLGDLTAPEERAALTDGAFDLAHESGDPGHLAFALRLRAVVRLMVGDRDGYADDRREIAVLAERLRSSFYRSLGSAWPMTLHMLDGRLDLATAHFEAAQGGVAPLSGVAVAVREAWLAFERGDLAESRRVLELWVRILPGSSGFRAALGRSCAALGDLDAAREHLDAIAAGDFAILRGGAWPLSATAHVAEICADLADASLAAPLYELARPAAGQLLVTSDALMVPCSTDRLLGNLASTLGWHDVALAHFADAVAFEESVPAPGLAVRTRYWWARAALKAGDAARTRELASRVSVEAQGFGMRHLVERAAALL